MNLLVTALHAEARPFIDHYRLKPVADCAGFAVYTNEKTVLIISGMGKVNAAAAVGFASAKFQIDYYFNIGISGGLPIFEIGALVVPFKIIDFGNGRAYFPEPQIKGDFREGTGFREGTLGTFDMPVTAAIEGVELYDMEASGFFEAATKFQAVSHVACLKIVSDHFDFSSLTKDSVTQSVALHVNTIAAYIEALSVQAYHSERDLSAEEQALLRQIGQARYLSVTQQHRLETLAQSFKARGGNVATIVEMKFPYNSDTASPDKRGRNEWFRAAEELFSAI
jgi:nucleoside phosphorylase